MEMDLKDDLEELTSLMAYPIKIPQSESYPAIVYKETGNTRNDDSNLDDANIRNRIYEIVIVTPDSEQLIDLKNQILSRYEGYSGDMGATKIFISRIIASVPYYDNAQNNFEYTISVRFTTH